MLSRSKITMNIKYQNVVLLLMLFSISTSIYTSTKLSPTFITYLVHDYNYAMDATWFDWGQRDIKVGYWEIYKSRYIDGIGL